jgi:hypothetical protein
MAIIKKSATNNGKDMNKNVSLYSLLVGKQVSTATMEISTKVLPKIKSATFIRSSHTTLMPWVWTPKNSKSAKANMVYIYIQWSFIQS